MTSKKSRKDLKRTAAIKEKMVEENTNSTTPARTFFSHYHESNSLAAKKKCEWLDLFFFYLLLLYPYTYTKYFQQVATNSTNSKPERLVCYLWGTFRTELGHIKNDNTKFFHVLSLLPPKVLSSLPSTILAAKEYEGLKDAVMIRHERTKPEMFKKIDDQSTNWTSPGGNTQQGTNYTADCLPSRKLSKLDESDMQDTAGEAGTSS